MNRETAAFIVIILAVAAALAWNAPATVAQHMPVNPDAERHAAGTWIVENVVDRDLAEGTRWRKKILEQCLRMTPNGQVNWVEAKACYLAKL